MSRIYLWAWALACACAQAAEPNGAMRRLTGSELREQVAGHEVTDGAHWADRYLPDGKAEGHSLGKTYVGSWTTENNELCLTRRAKVPRTDCFEVWQSGTGVEYRRGGATLAGGVLRDAGRPGAQQ